MNVPVESEIAYQIVLIVSQFVEPTGCPKHPDKGSYCSCRTPFTEECEKVAKIIKSDRFKQFYLAWAAGDELVEV